MNPLKRFSEFILNPSNRKTVSALVILIIAAAVPLTVLVAQKQQEIRQRAAPSCTAGQYFCTDGSCHNASECNLYGQGGREYYLCTGTKDNNTTCFPVVASTSPIATAVVTSQPISSTKACSVNFVLCPDSQCYDTTTNPPCQERVFYNGTHYYTCNGMICPSGLFPSTSPVTTPAPTPVCYPLTQPLPSCLANNTCTIKKDGNVYYYCITPTPTPITSPTPLSSCTPIPCCYFADKLSCQLPYALDKYCPEATAPPARCTGASPTATPVIPNCDSGGVYTSPCTSTQANTCSNNGTRTYQYKTSSTGQQCSYVTTTVTCSVNNCSSGNACVNGVCSGASVTASPTTSPSTSPTSNPSASPSPSTSASPSPTPAPGDTVLALSVGMDGVGNTGTNQNPVPLSNWKDNPPKTLLRNVTVEVWDSNNNEVIKDKPTKVTYDSAKGYFTGTVNLGGSFVSGNYTVKVKSDGHLKKLALGIQNITHGALAQIPRVNLIAGDINGDNSIDIKDYNIFISCSVFGSSGISFSPNSPFDSGALCNTAGANYQALSDLDDNEVIDQIDYNLFLGEYSIQNGD